MPILVFRDLRLAGAFVTNEAIQPVDENVPLAWMIDRVRREQGTVQLQFWSHGLPGYVQCGRGRVEHPSAGPGITVHDAAAFKKLAGKVDRIEFRACLVASVGTCPECEGEIGYDGHASLLPNCQGGQSHGVGLTELSVGGGNEDCGWAGTVLTWDKTGGLIDRADYPLYEAKCATYT